MYAAARSSWNYINDSPHPVVGWRPTSRRHKALGQTSPLQCCPVGPRDVVSQWTRFVCVGGCIWARRGRDPPVGRSSFPPSSATPRTNDSANSSSLLFGLTSATGVGDVPATSAAMPASVGTSRPDWRDGCIKTSLVLCVPSTLMMSHSGELLHFQH